MAKRKREGNSLPHMLPSAPDGRQYTNSELVCASTALEMPLGGKPLEHLPREVWIHAYQFAHLVRKHTGYSCLLYELQDVIATKVLICGLLGQRIGANSFYHYLLGHLPPTSRERRRTDRKAARRLRRELGVVHD